MLVDVDHRAVAGKLHFCRSGRLALYFDLFAHMTKRLPFPLIFVLSRMLWVQFIHIKIFLIDPEDSPGIRDGVVVGEGDSGGNRLAHALNVQRRRVEIGQVADAGLYVAAMGIAGQDGSPGFGFLWADDPVVASVDGFIDRYGVFHKQGRRLAFGQKLHFVCRERKYLEEIFR